MRKNILYKLISIVLLFILGIANTNAIKITIDSSLTKEVSLSETINYYGELLDEYIPNSYKYITLNIKGVDKETQLYSSLQKLIYYDLIKNNEIIINPNQKLSGYEFYKIAETILDVKIINKDNINYLKQRKANKGDFNLLKTILESNNSNIEFDTTKSKNNDVELKKEIFGDVYETILNKHYNKKNLDEAEIISSAIKGMVKGVGDIHTVYFPPIENKNFQESLNGEYEGIGSYVELVSPGVVKIVSPIKDSPSEKAGIKGGDIILKVDGKKVEEKHSLQEVVSWIKGPAGTIVLLTIKRGQEEIEIEVKREKIIIVDVEGEKLDSKTFYIDIKTFGENVSSNFKNILEQIKDDKNINKIIIDLRNNGGGYLEQVSDILGYFVEKGGNTAVVKYLDSEKIYDSIGYEMIKFHNYKIILLQNSGTASASEIMIGTIKDYYPDSIIIGEKSYGKGSVQTIKSYSDGSSLKYTVAKWYTGKTQTGIDGIGIIPDVELKFDDDLYKEKEIDNQLKRALEY